MNLSLSSPLNAAAPCSLTTHLCKLLATTAELWMGATQEEARDASPAKPRANAFSSSRLTPAFNVK